MVRQGYTATLVAATLAISRSSLYYRKRPRGSRADRTYDEQIIVACGEKLAYGYRRVAWWLQRKEGLRVNRKRVLRVMRERGLLVRSRRLRARRKKEWGRVEAAEPNQIWQTDMTKIWAGPAVGWAYLVCVLVRRHITGDAGLYIFDGDIRVWNCCVGRVRHGTGESRARHLCAE